MDFYFHQKKFPVGNLGIVCSQLGFHTLFFEKDFEMIRTLYHPLNFAPHSIFIRRVFQQLDEYFASKRFEFDFPMAMFSSHLQLQVLDEFQKASFGQPLFFEMMIKKFENNEGSSKCLPQKTRLMACHQVIAKNGELKNFYGDGKPKRFFGVIETSPWERL